MRRILDEHEPVLSLAISESLLAGWAFGAAEVAKQLPKAQDRFGQPPRRNLPWTGGADDRPFRFPLIEKAAKELEDRQIVTPEEFQRISEQARVKAFTAANLATEDAVAKVRKALVEDVRQGGTLKQFRDKLNEALDTSALSKSAVENIYRTNVGVAYERGKEDLVEGTGEAFPFVLDVKVHDSRISEICEGLTGRGIQGTDVFLRDDPEWKRLRPTRHHNCRCSAVYLTVRDAARRGIEYAKEWLRLGHKPPNPPYVERIPVELPRGWTR